MSNISESIERAADPTGDSEAEWLKAFLEANTGRQIVVVQGLGFVGTAMVAALAAARDAKGRPSYAVIGLDLADSAGMRKIAAVRRGEPPIVSTDAALDAAFREAAKAGNLTATANASALRLATIVVVDINLDVRKVAHSREYVVQDQPFRRAIATIGDHVAEGTLIVVETTIPPGTTQSVVLPIIAAGMRRRGLDPSRVQIAHSYERVMPGANYLASVTDYYRVFAGIDSASSARARAFLESFINTRDFPLTELDSTTACETAKVLENTFRAVNIALIQEWSEFAEDAGIDLFRVIEAIRVRPTHRNIMLPGFGVGGYCLTKDSLLADAAARSFSGGAHRLKMSLGAIDVNDAMPLHTLRLMKKLVPSLSNHNVTILGLSYLNDVADTRSSPTEILYDACIADGAHVRVHDPLVGYWPEKNMAVDCRMDDLAAPPHAEIVVFAVRHREYLALTSADVLSLFPKAKVIVDGNGVLTDHIAAGLRAGGLLVAGVGKGHWRRLFDDHTVSR